MNIKSANKSAPGWYQRLFAWLMAHATAKYEAEMSDRKREMFADLHSNILENDKYTASFVNLTTMSNKNYINYN